MKEEKKIWIHQFYCVNGAFHSYLCCDTCANRFKKVLDTDEDFRLSHSREIEASRKEYFILMARKVGFTKKKQNLFMIIDNQTLNERN